MSIYDLGSNQSVVCVTSILDSCSETGISLNYDCYRLNLLENSFESSAKHEIPCIIAQEVLAVKTVLSDSCHTVLLKCRDGSKNSVIVKCCHWITPESPSFETLSSHCTSIHWEPLYITDSLFCMLSDDNVISFVDISKPSVVGQIFLKDHIVKLLHVFCIQDSYVLLYCISPNDKLQHLAALTVSKSYKQSDEQLDVNDFVPSLYGEVIRCATVQIRQSFDEREKTNHNCSYICTSRKQLVCFKDGRLIQCNPLPFDDATKIQLFATPSFQKIVVVQNDAGDLVCIELATGKVLHSFAGVTRSLVDDFLCCGSEQLLIIFDQLLASFVLIDFEAVLIDKRSKGSEQRKDEDISGAEQFTQVLNALSHRLQVGRSSLVQLETHLKEKDALIEAACLNIQQMSLGESTSSVKQPPVKSAHREPTEKEPSLPVLVLATWKKLVVDQIVLGVKLRNTSDHRLLKPCLQLSPTSPPHGHAPTACISKTFVSSLSVSGGSGQGSEPTSRKRLKMDSNANDIHTEFHSADCVEPGQVFFTTGTVPASSVALWNKLDITLSLFWHSDKTRAEEVRVGSVGGKSGKKGHSVRTPSMEDRGHVLVIGRETISGKHLGTLGMSCCSEKGSDLHEHEVFQELLSLNATQQCCELVVQATVSPVTAVLHRILVEELHFHRFEAFQCVICCDKRSLFHHARAQLDSEARCTGTLRIWTKESPQLVLLLRAIYAHSPDDLLILPANQKSRNKDMTSAITAMHGEISLVTERLQTLASGTSAEDTGRQEVAAAAAMETNSDMTEAQKHFLSEQSTVCSSKRKTVNAKPSTWNNVNSARAESDEAVLRLTNVLRH